MRTIQYIIFFSIVISVLVLINFYIYSRGAAALPASLPYRNIYIFTFIFLASSFLIGRIMERIWLSPVSFAFTWIGSFWLAAMAYFFLIVLLVDIIRLLNTIFHFYPSFITNNPERFRFVVFCSVTALVFLLLVAGHFNAIRPRIRSIHLNIPKTLDSLSSLKIVAVSDIHLGTIIGPRRVKRMVNKINSLDPDLVLLAGDVVDEDLGPVIHQNTGKELSNIRSRYGVFSITGNHEYIGGVEKAVNYLSKHNITVLRDSVAKISEEIYIVGREDHDQARFGGKGKKSLSELMKDVDLSKPVIVLDHQPTNLKESVENDADLHISGHTHHGQIWPFSLITKRIYPLSWGYERRGNTHLYVSSGYGTWGPPVRIGSSPEIVEFNIRFINSIP